jgi:hypothetical protein
MSCCDSGCETAEVGFAAGSPGTPGGTLPDGDAGDFLQWNGTLWVPSSWTLPFTTTENDLGEVLTVTAAGVAEFQPLFQRTLLFSFGLQQVQTNALWAIPWQFSSVPLVTASAAGFIFPLMSGRVRDMRVLHSTPLVGADNITYTFVVNGVNTPLAVTLNMGAASGSNLVDVVNVGATDQLSLLTGGQTATRLIRPAIYFTLEF